MKAQLLSILLSLFGSGLVIGQTQTIGLQKSNLLASEGYTLFTPSNNGSVYLINNCGEKINEWTFNERPAITCYLLDNGNLLRAGADSLEIRDWNNNVIWSYAMDANGYLQHHDIHPLPNGNVICICSDNYTSGQAKAAGRRPDLSIGNVKFERIIELQPVGNNDANLVWEWKFFDHLIQDFDGGQNNFGIVEDHPELLDVNFQTIDDANWIHVNSVEYNPIFDQILISARHLNEIFIIDHSTTTAQAAGHTGGNSDKGGDFLWRWGNPQVYRQGSNSDQKLFLQHDAKWVPSNYADSGKISVFNNGGSIDNNYSSLDLIQPIFNNNSYEMGGGKFLPNTTSFSWNGSLFGNVIYEAKRGGWQSQVNGNLLLCTTSTGQVSEFTKTGEHIWSYCNPTGTDGLIYNQFDVLPLNSNVMFRAERYPSSFVGFAGKNMTPQGIIENVNAESAACLSLSVDELVEVSRIKIVNPIINNQIEFFEEISTNKLEIFDLKGQLVIEKTNFSGNRLDLNLESGSYLLRIESEKGNSQQRFIVI